MSASVHDSTTASNTQSVISAAGANQVLEAGVAKASELGVPVVVAVVDAAGVLKAFLAMDGVPPVATRWAIDKAVTAASFRMPTHALAEGVGGDPSVLASVMAQPHATLAPAGLPLVVDGVVVGAVGASGGTPEQDSVVANAGADALSAP